MSKKNKTLILVLMAIIIAVAVIYFVFLNKKSPQQTVEGGETADANQTLPEERTYTLTPSKENSENNIYADSQYNFSFEYPKNFTATKFSEGESSDTILVQNTDSGQGFQIFVSFFDEPGPLTKERVLQDLPELVMKSPEQRILKITAPSKVEGLLFFSEEPSMGETREIWFIYNNYLYQITTTAAMDSLVAQIIATWKFEL